MASSSLGSAIAYSTFAGLPAPIQERIRSAIEPADPEAWINTPIAVLGHRSFLDVVNGPDGGAAANTYLESVERMEKSWVSASSVAFDATSDSYRFRCGLTYFDLLEPAFSDRGNYQGDLPAAVAWPLAVASLTQTQLRMKPVWFTRAPTRAYPVDNIEATGSSGLPFQRLNVKAISGVPLLEIRGIGILKLASALRELQVQR